MSNTSKFIAAGHAYKAAWEIFVHNGKAKEQGYDENGEACARARHNVDIAACDLRAAALEIGFEETGK